MMRSPNFFAVACRAPNGEIILQNEPLEKTWIGRQQWLKLPFLRGSLALLDTIALGVKAMRFAANVQVDPRYQAESDAPAAPQSSKEKRIQDVAIGGTVIISLGLGLLIFNYLPNVIAQFAAGRFDERITNLTTEIVKIVFFLGYLGLIGLMPDIREVFKYHGAEHKAINALEADQPLTIESTKQQTRLHPRCGTSFAIVVLIVSLLIFTFFPRYPFGRLGNPLAESTVRFLVELCVLPLISGISYEVIRWAGKFRNTWFVQTLLYPGLMSQYLTTREPDDRQVEVALVALRAVTDAEAIRQGLPPANQPLESSASAETDSPAPHHPPTPSPEPTNR